MAPTAEVAATVEAAETVEVEEMAEAAKAAEWAASDYPSRSASATAPATPNSQHGGFLGSVRTNLGAGSLAATSARPALAARGAPRERHEDEYWVADSNATKNMIQDSSYLEDYTPAPPGDEVERAAGVLSLSQDTGV